jgi:Na+-translocating ferredoxin:NAD+ oxidoreductase RnfC subunit
MAKSYIDRIRDAGVVGAGGAGFPTHIKINNNAEVIIANGAECEPLLRIDRQMMETFPEKLIEGMQVVMKISKADKGVICLKGKYHLAIEKLTKAIGNKKKIELYLLDNYYPAGDEQQMVYEVTGKVVPTGGLPIDVGVIVNNVSTLINVADSIEEIPVTNKFVTVTGEVKNPVTLSQKTSMSSSVIN